VPWDVNWTVKLGISADFSYSENQLKRATFSTGIPLGCLDLKSLFVGIKGVGEGDV
jgi:hypothetical protein